MSETETKTSGKEAAEDSSIVENSVSSPVDESSSAPLTRKRTRDDFEADNKEEAEEEERKIAPLKRRKSVTEDSKDASGIENLKKVDVIAEASKEATAEAEEAEEQTKDEVPTANDTPKTEPCPEAEKSEVSGVDSADATAEVKAVSEETKTDEKSKDTETKSADTKPKFVFGSTTPFGANAFSMVNKKKNVFESAPSASKVTTGSVFGSSSSFGNSFQAAITKKSIFEGRSKEMTPELSNDNESESPATTNMYKQVDLEKKDIKSGEEDEEQVFTCRAKLYVLELANVRDGWKERGVGNVHVNRSTEDVRSSRIIMRSNGLLKVILNTALVKGLEVIKGMPSSMNPEKFIRIMSMEDKKPVQYAIKTGNIETTDTLFRTLTDLIPKDA